MRKVVSSLLLFVSVLGAGVANAQVPPNPYNYSRGSAFEYDATSGLLTSETVEPNNPASCVTTTYLYDSYGNKRSASVANCAGAGGNDVFLTRASSSTYSAQTVTVAGINVAIPPGTFPTVVNNALSQSESKTFDPRFGAVLSLTGPNALTTTWELDDFGRTVRESRADGTSSVSYYCYLAGKGVDTSSSTPGCPAPTSSEAPVEAISFVHSEQRNTSNVKNGPFSRAYMDRVGRKIRTVTEAFDGATQPGGVDRLIVQDTDYSVHGAPLVTTQPYFLDTRASINGGAANSYGMSTSEYDALGRPIRVYNRDPLGGDSATFGSRGTVPAAVTTIAYSGLTVTTTSDKGQTRIEEKNADGKLVRVTDAFGAQIAYQHDAFGNLLQTKDALQNIVTVRYDIRGRKIGMTDPDTGTWEYNYNALGELVWQRNPNQLANGQATTMAYDKLGRMTSRIEPEYTSTWTYDNCVKGVGKLCATSTTNGVSRKMVYDALGRPVNARTTVSGGPSFASAVSYDADDGRPSSQTYPSGLKVNYNYTAKGFLSTLTMATTATVGGKAVATLWQAQAYNALGQVEKQLYGNNVVGRASFDAATGRVSGTSAGIGAATAVMNYSYSWDSLNHLTGRADANGDGATGAVTDGFDYDAVGRLKSYSVSAAQIPGLTRVVTLEYNALGSMLYKSDVGEYGYPVQGAGVTQPHAVQWVNGRDSSSKFGSYYKYDLNGNVTESTGAAYRSVSYTSFNLPDAQTGLKGVGGVRYTWQYDENHQRIKETRVNTSGTRTTWMVHPDNAGGLSFESEQNGAATSNRHYLSAGGMSIGVLVSSGALPVLAAAQTEPTALSSIVFDKVEYWHKDHLGSLVATTNESGVVTARYSYDPFGKRRTASGKYDEQGRLLYDWNGTSSGTDRGYTGHEHLDDVGVIHMNGRLYDPLLGLFMQGDPYIQDPSDLQNYNRYGYCYNNPMTCTDPTGYKSLWMKIRPQSPFSGGGLADPGGYVLSKVAHTKVGYQLGSIAIGVLSVIYCEGGAWACNAEGQAIWAGFAGRSFGEAVKIGVIAGATSYAMNAVGGEWVGSGDTATAYSSFMNTVGHAAVGCASSLANSGSCQSGAVAGGLSAAWGNYGPGYVVGNTAGSIIQNTMVAAAIGGTTSVLSGGNFANGATTGAFGYLFNHWAHELELAVYGRDAHKTLQDIMYQDGLVVERKSAGGREVNGRFDIARAETLELWEIKRFSIAGIAAGEIVLNAYTDNTGFQRGGDLPRLKVGDTLNLRGDHSTYTFKNMGRGLILYSVDPVRFQIRLPFPLPLPGSSANRLPDPSQY
ncbi:MULTISPECIES: RHS repeat-associated core domain-containing protein [unclassified Janthinobacterium]|uniref:RHS repeat-associated core domain-containing protein n=1 Tax=unclassified Janthinobacterium TaxID=2610881 RepID=UPI00034A35B1|nr:MULTISPECIES: RHS repeat-associated core domain-containing protein [unclassified Janthinobacterium]MEC5161530.1 RHS repeat-associated protein [Janthinobacterium sp. CG_S6]